MSHRVGFLGAGNMAAALASGFVKSGLALGPETSIYDIVEEKAQSLAQSLGAEPAASVADVLGAADVIVLAVKPLNISELAAEIAPHVKSRHLFISILAGVDTSKIESLIGGAPRVVRAMPNTPALVGQSASALARGKHASPNDLRIGLELFGSVGDAIEVDEGQLDAVTGLSGSGPAYFFLMMEALIEAGRQQGLDPEMARRLVLQTALGAGQLAKEAGVSPLELRERVTSKGGTTAAGLGVLDEGGFKELVGRCVEAAVKRSEELGKQ